MLIYLHFTVPGAIPSGNGYTARTNLIHTTTSTIWVWVRDVIVFQGGCEAISLTHFRKKIAIGPYVANNDVDFSAELASS
jgi:hypothetical protein